MSKLLSHLPLAIRGVFCFVAAFLNAVAIGFQGNGNLILTGLLIGLALGSVWSVLLVFAAPAWVRHFRPSFKTALTGALLITALLVLPLISFYLWGHAISFAPWAKERSPLEARPALCLHIEAHWPGASESERWPVGRTPQGFHLLAQGCEERATLGMRSERSSKGLHPSAGGMDARLGYNPFRVAGLFGVGVPG